MAISVRVRSGRVVCLSIAIAAALAIGGCGEDSETETSLTAAEFTSQAEAICGQARVKVQREFREFEKQRGFSEQNPMDIQGQKEVIKTIVVPSLESQAKRLEALAAPDPERTEELVAALTAIADESKKEPLSALSSSGDSWASVSELSGELRVPGCSAPY